MFKQVVNTTKKLEKNIKPSKNTCSKTRCDIKKGEVGEVLDDIEFKDIPYDDLEKLREALDVDNLVTHKDVLANVYIPNHRPYGGIMNLLKDIIEDGTQLPDTKFKAENAFRVVTEGYFNKSHGIFEVIINVKNSEIYHVVFSSIKKGK